MNGARFDEIMEAGALALGAQAVAEERLEPGGMVSHYRIVEEIGRGGMGVVYRAFDTTLERDVALKVLLVGRRLWDEARAAAQLKHPNIGVVYEIGESEGIPFLAMELLEGESLGERLERGRIELADARAIASEVAAGLAHAHDKGVVHRDLKPANIMLAAHGAKIIDFGLAGDVDTQAPMGTPGYAAPEQMRGEPADARSDVYSFGVLLKELLGGRERRITARCLAADPNERYEAAAALRADLEQASTRRRSWRWLAAVIVPVAVAVTLMSRSPDAIVLSDALQLTSDVGIEEHPRWSPDGESVAYDANLTGEWDVWLTGVDGRPENLTVDFDEPARFPSWSPDGTRIVFWSERGTNDGRFMIMTPSGGRPRPVASSDTAGAVEWSGDGSRILFVNDTEAHVFKLDNGIRETIMLPGSNASRFHLSWSEDENYVAYIDANAVVDEVTRLWALRISDGASFLITDGQTNVWSPSWSKNGRYLYFVSNRGGAMDLWRQRFGSDGGAGEPEQLTVGVGVRNARFSDDGRRLVYSQGRKVANLWRVPIIERASRWQDAEQLTFDQALVEFVDVSADGERLVVSSDRSGNQDLWIVPAGGGEMTQLTSARTPDWSPIFSPDGTEIAFYSYRSGNRDLWIVPASGAGAPRQLTRNPGEDYRMAFSPVGDALVFDSTRSGSWDLWSFDFATGSVRALTTHAAIDSDARYSPDGSRLVFGSQRSGGFRLWEMPAAGGEPTVLSEGPGRNPRFSPDGRFIYFHGDAGRAGSIWRLDLETGDETAVTELIGRRGGLGVSALATDGSHLYFTWEDDLGELWVLDVEHVAR